MNKVQVVSLLSVRGVRFQQLQLMKTDENKGKWPINSWMTHILRAFFCLYLFCYVGVRIWLLLGLRTSSLSSPPLPRRRTPHPRTLLKGNLGNKSPLPSQRVYFNRPPFTYTGSSLPLLPSCKILHLDLRFRVWFWCTMSVLVLWVLLTCTRLTLAPPSLSNCLVGHLRYDCSKMLSFLLV